MMKLTKLILIFLLLNDVDCFNSFNLVDSQLFKDEKFPNLFVWLTVNPEVQIFNNPFKSVVLSQRLLELNWAFKDSTPNQLDWIGLFDKAPDPNVDILPDQAIYSNNDPSKQNNGKIISNRKYPILDFSLLADLPKGCLGYYIGYIRDRKLLSSNCLAAYSSWMQDIYEKIKDAPIHDLMLAGTHNSGAYSLGYPQTNIAKRKINDYTLCQDESVFNQLVYGIRHLDLRVAYRDKSFTITHDKFNINHSLNSVLDQILKFIEMSTMEVVIVDFHRFPSGFPKDNAKYKEVHKMMFEVIKSKLGNHIMPSVNQRYLVKYGELISKNKRIIIGHAAWFALDDTDRQLIFPPAVHIWKDSQDSLDKLLPLVSPWNDSIGMQICNNELLLLLLEYWIVEKIEFLKQKMCTTHRNELEAEAAFLTPTAKNVILNKYKSLRALSTKVNRPLTDEFRDSAWFNCSNVVLTDFFLGNNLIQLAIESNLKRFV